MSTKQHRGRDVDSPLDVLTRSFALLAEGPGQPVMRLSSPSSFWPVWPQQLLPQLVRVSELQG
jgi:hypothetical protein